MPHPIHLHGHPFQVVKMGYPITDPDTSLFRGKSRDIRCLDEGCNQVTWSDPGWKNGQIPGVISEGAPLKDTIQVPAGGYTVIRFKADNPGMNQYK